jgi:hypothetical protein
MEGYDLLEAYHRLIVSVNSCEDKTALFAT